MNNYTLFSLALGMLCSTSVYAQDAVVSEMVSTNDSEDLYIIGGDAQGFYVGVSDDYYMSGSGNKQVITYYDMDNAKAVESKVIKQEDRSRDFFYTFSFKDQVHTLSYDNKQSEDGLFHIYLNSYNQQMESVGDEKDLDQVYPYIFNFEVGSMLRSYFSSQFGKMRKGMFITHKANAAEDKIALFFDFNYFTSTVANFQCVVLDQDREVVWSGLIDLPEEGSNLLLEDYALGNDGKLYMLMAAFENENFKKTASNFEYRLYQYNPESEQVDMLDFDTEGRFIINMGLSLGQDQQPVLGGIYANPQNNDIEGGLRVSFQADGSSSLEEYAFDNAILQDINEKEDKESAEEYTINNTVLEDDGSMVFFAESYKRGPIVTAKLRLSAFNPLDTDIEIGDIYKKILAVKITPDGGSNWVKLIDKNQRSSEPKDIYASFALAYTDEAYYLLFNNDIKSSSDISLVTIKQDGDISLQTFMDKSDYRMRLIPEFARMLEPGILTVPVEKSRKQGVLRIKF